MNNLIGCALMPHPPIMVPEVGKEETVKVQATVVAVEKAAKVLKENNPQTIVIISPHGPQIRDSAVISVHPRLRGNLGAFGVPEVTLGFETDGLLVRHIIKQAERLGVNLVELTDDLAKNYRTSLALDHGAFVPLYFMHKAGFKGQLVHLSVGMMPYAEMYTFGKAVQAALRMVDKKVAVIASGDLSHRLLPEAPAGYSPRGKEFDQEIVAALEKLDAKQLMNIDDQLVCEAGQCGLGPILFLTGVMGGMDSDKEVLSYEGPFGVGYAVALFTSIKPAASGKERKCRSSYTALAKKSLQSYLAEGKVMEVPRDLLPEMEQRAGVFVSLKKKGELRGCIGTFLPTKENVAAEIIANAVSAGTQDPRFAPVKLQELDELDFSVDVLSAPERVDDLSELDPQKYGVIVKSAGRTGLLLPMLEGIDTVDSQVMIAMQKAGIKPDEEIEAYRFTVTRHQ